MKRNIFLFSSLFGLIKAQIPLNGDTSVNGKMHIAVEEEKAEILSAEVSAAFQDSLAHEVMLNEEFHTKNKLLRERGSKKLSDGSEAPENKNVGVQIIDPRTPEGFGNPFFRKIHVEMNQEMNTSPMVKEALSKSNETLDPEDLPIGCTNIEDCIDYDRDGYSDSVKGWEIILAHNVTIVNANYKEEADLYINRTLYWNESKIDYVTSNFCVTSYGSKSCSVKEYVYNENAWDLEVSLFPNGICPHPCQCVKSLGGTKKLGKDLEEKCFDYCAGKTLRDIFRCKTLMAAGEKNRQAIKVLLNERLPGFGPGLKLKRNHPLAGEIRRFVGVF